MRHQFIPVRKADIVGALVGDLEASHRRAFGELCRLFALTLHYEFFDELERLKEAYFHFDPKVAASRRISDADYEEFLETLRRVLLKANFLEVTQEEIDRAWRERAMMPVDVRAPIEDYRDIRFFKRGAHRETTESSDWFGLRRRHFETEVYDDVVLVAAAHPVAGTRRGKKRKPPPPGAVFIKYFHGIAGADLNALLPEIEVVMNMRDRWFLGLPALVGAVPLMLKLAPTLAILFLLAGIQLGYSGTVESDQLKQALAVTSGLIALGSFATHQWLKYQRQALRYQVAIRDNLYFRNVNNNSGVFDALVGAAEEQEFKEAVLAYQFLLAGPCDEATLDGRIEAWLKNRFGVDVDFEVDDGLAKLERFGLLAHEGGRLSVVPVAEALRRLDRRWDDLFNYREAAE
jgi:hypothetical protein